MHESLLLKVLLLLLMLFRVRVAYVRQYPNGYPSDDLHNEAFSIFILSYAVIVFISNQKIL